MNRNPTSNAKDHRTRRRRVHSAEFKANVLVQCREPGASVAAVALANGINANLARSWLAGRGIARAGLKREVRDVEAATGPGEASALTVAQSSRLRFIPLEMPEQSGGAELAAVARAGRSDDSMHIEVELRRADAAGIVVRWPVSQLQPCTAWLRELAGAVLK